MSVAPTGGRWRVGRRFLLWRPTRRIRFELDPVGVLLALVALPLLLFEWLLALTAATVAAAVRVALRRPWTVTATLDAPSERRLGWQVHGWRAAGELADRVRGELADGTDPSTHADTQAVHARIEHR